MSLIIAAICMLCIVLCVTHLERVTVSCLIVCLEWQEVKDLAPSIYCFLIFWQSGRH